ncbi:hypothetical protein B9Z19DRAFT_1136899 [Tuber borchii]|uniref:Uncharacterized protein n=1 Tax=Tuber borchii TaxID=42251 RepID=A0A2T6ZB47_TUBBO|nr:hypothetical protein B9Z19DRAFT_1136899 [Tuber borchii]
MLSQQNIASQHSQSPQELEGADPYLSSEYNTSPGALHMPGPGLGDNQKEPDLGSGIEPSERKIWGLKRKTFVIMLGIFILLIIAVACQSQQSQNPQIAKPVVHWSKALTWRQNSPSPASSGGHPSIVTVTASISSSPIPTPIRKNTPFAAVNWNNGYIQLLYKHTDGSIRLQKNNGSQWGGQLAQVTKPKDDSGLAAIAWLDGDVRQVRVYTAGENNALTESVWNSSSRLWYDQGINDISTSKGIAPLAAGSHLTAYTWHDGKVLHIRVYYQGQDGYIREAAYDSTGHKGWWKGDSPAIQDFPRAKSGSGLAIVSFPDTNAREAKLFYQNMDGELRSFDAKPAATWVKTWQNFGFLRSLFGNGYGIYGAQVTAVSCILATGELALRIYFIRDGKLVEIWWTRKAGWNSWYMHDAVAPGVSTISSTDDVNVFFQTETGHFSDMSLNRHATQWQFTPIVQSS